MPAKKGKTKSKKAGSGSGSSSSKTRAVAAGFDVVEGGGGQQHDSSGGGSGGASKKPKGGGGGGASEDFLRRRRTPGYGDNSEPGGGVGGGGGGDFRHTNGGSSSSGDRERDRDTGERDRDKDGGSRGLGGGGIGGDDCHNGESLCRSPYIRSSAGKQWSWLGYSAKQFRSFAQEFPPMLDVGAEEVRLKIEDIKCSTCRDRLLKALGRGLRRGGFPLTKLVKLAACRSGEEERGDHSQRLEEACTPTSTPPAAATGGRGDAGGGDGRAPVVLSNGRSSVVEESQKRAEAAAGGSGGNASGNVLPSDRLRIRAPVTPDLLRQVIGVVQQAALVPPAADAAGKKEGAATDLSAEEWLSTYPAPDPFLLEAGEAKSNAGGLRGTGTGSLSFSRGSFGGSGGGHGRSDSAERNPWALMERVDRARDNAFKCCGVIETSAGGASSSGGGGLLESSGSLTGGGSSSMAGGMEWNPQFAPRLQEAEAAILEWLTELTMALHGLTFQFTLAFIGEEDGDDGSTGSSDLAESTALAEDLWTAYEESVKRQLELTLEARREQLREQSQPMGLALCFTAQNRVLASELLGRKRTEMTALHQATIGVMAAAKLRPLLQRAERARQKWSGLLLPEDVYALDDLVERVLRARLQVFKVESFAYNASSDVIQAEQMADAQLKTVVQEWEAMLDGLKARVEYRVSEELNSTVYPQSPALTSALQTWLSTFQADWVGNETTQQLHAHIRQRQVHQLCQTLVAKKQRLKATKDEANEFGKQRRKRDARAASGNGVFSPSAEQAEDMAKQREFEERCQSLATAISLTQQEQIETCLTYRLFAVGQLHQRYRRLRLFFAQLGSRVGARESQAALLCGGEGQAEERIKMVGVCLMLGVVEEACLKWTAVQNERQLVEGMNREDASQDAKRRKRERAKAKVRETKTAAAAAVAAAAALAEAAEASLAAVASSSPSSSKEGHAVDPSPAQASAEGGQAAAPGAEAAAAAAAAAEDRQHPAPGDNEDNSPREHRRGSSGEGLGKAAPAAVRNGEERSTPRWHGAERAAPPGGDEDEDGFVTIAKSKPRRSTAAAAAAAARENSFLQQNGRLWGGGRGGGGRDGGGRGRGGGGAAGGGYGFEGKERTPRDARPYEQDRRSRAAGAAVPGGARLSSSTSAAAGWAQRNRGVVQEPPEVGTAAAPPPPPAGAGAAGGLPVAPEEELPADSTEEVTVKNAREFSGDEVTGAEEAEEVGKTGGAAAAASSGELGPEREVAGVTTEGTKEGDGAEGGADAGAAVEEEEEEEFVFQFGTVNLSDEDAAAAGEDAGRDAGSDTAVEARHSPENLRQAEEEEHHHHRRRRRRRRKRPGTTGRDQSASLQGRRVGLRRRRVPRPWSTISSSLRPPSTRRVEKKKTRRWKPHGERLGRAHHCRRRRRHHRRRRARQGRRNSRRFRRLPPPTALWEKPRRRRRWRRRQRRWRHPHNRSRGRRPLWRRLILPGRM
ncbi:unnamed protein product [Ectocarpus fasciculatus]